MSLQYNTGGYSALANFYDLLTDRAEQQARSFYYMDLFRKYAGGLPALMLDLACGSLGASIDMLDCGVEVIGVDASQEFLSLAAEKAAAAGASPLLLCQDMRELDLYGTVEGAICAADGLNHLLCTADIAEVFRRLRLFIEPNGLFIFDVNTPHKHINVLADEAFVFDTGQCYCVWQNRLIPRTCETDMSLDFFVPGESGYTRLTDHVRERAYSVRTLSRLLSESGFEILSVFDDLSYNPPNDKSEKIVFVARNKPERMTKF